jgi:hypothetical protein
MIAKATSERTSLLIMGELGKNRALLDPSARLFDARQYFQTSLLIRD